VSLVADFSIVTIDGTYLCSLADVEVERHESSPHVAVSQRHDVVFQPFANPAVTVEAHIIDRSPHEDMRPLYNYLDVLASEVITSTLGSKPMVGTEVRLFVIWSAVYLPLLSQLDRQRYFNFSAKVVAAFTPAQLFDDNEVSEFRQKWPDMMEVTDRVASAHVKILQSSKVTGGLAHNEPNS
jgi:hypothetical protein